MTQPRNPFSLDDKVALVTGGNGGIGLAIAEALGAAGASIAVVGRNPEKSQAAIVKLREAGIAASAHDFDLVDATRCRKAVDDVLDRHARLDVLVNCAGINVRKRPEEYREDEVMDVLQVDLLSPYHLSVAAYKGFMRDHGGSIINIGSLLSHFGGAQFAPYSMAKGGLVQLTRSMAIAWANDEVRVNAILPGWFDTDLTLSARQTVPGLNDKVLRDTPMARWGRPEEIGSAAVMLACTSSSFTTGASLCIDGGFGVAI